jgi:hypothetical protein
MLYDLGATEIIQSVLDWTLIPEIDLGRPWWNPDATGLFMVDGKQYFTAGDMTLGYLSRAMCYLVNRDLYDALGLKEDLFAAVREGRWTQDLFLTLAAQSVMDTDGDGAYTAADTYGVFGNPRGFLNTLVGGAGIRYVESDENGHFVFRMSKNEDAVNVLTKAVQFMTSHPNLYYNRGTVPYEVIPDTLFATGQALFHVQGLPHTIVQLRDMDDDFSILPLPKRDESQSDYYAPAYGSALTSIPKTVAAQRYENIGLLLEAMTRKTWEDVVPQYKEVLLKHKMARDAESADMLDIIFNSITFDPGVLLWCGDLSDDICQKLFMAKNDAVVSYLEEKTPVYQQLIDSFNKSVS